MVRLIVIGGGTLRGTKGGTTIILVLVFMLMFLLLLSSLLNLQLLVAVHVSAIVVAAGYVRNTASL